MVEEGTFYLRVVSTLACTLALITHMPPHTQVNKVVYGHPQLCMSVRPTWDT